MIVYHGGYCSIESPEIRVDVYTKDFGPGFYCTEIEEQAIRRTRRFDTKVISVYDYDENNDLNTLHFTKMNDEWLDFIVSCRNGVSHNYDIVIGAMANDQIYNYISEFVAGNIDREQFWVMAKFAYPTHQINFCTNAALACLYFTESKEVENDRS